MSILNDYMVSYRCERGQRLFNIFHRTAPMLKLLAFASVFVAIFWPILFIATALLWTISVVINYIKWYTIYTYNYIIEQKRLTVTKTYNYIKPQKLADVEFKDILNLQIIGADELENYETNKFFCKQERFDLYLLIKTIDISFIIVVNNYFYALLQRKTAGNRN